MKTLAEQGREAQTERSRYLSFSQTAEEAGRVLGQYADTKQAEVINSIETVCSAGLTSVFGKEMKLHLRQTVRARRSEIDITVESDGVETAVMDARGGGLAACVGILLRVTMILLSGSRRILIADEPFAHLSEEYSVPMAEFLSDLFHREGMQAIFVTHNMEFADVADQVITVSQSNNKAVVK